jgi:pimeloyl-ACP methyl ester carboxylesterase
MKAVVAAAMMSAMAWCQAALPAEHHEHAAAAHKAAGQPEAPAAHLNRKRAFLDTPFGQVYYVTQGQGEPVLLLHQTPSSMDQYAELIPLLAKTKRVIAMDNLGFGDSDKPARQLSIEEYGATVVQLLDELGIAKASIIGYHTGAFIGIEVATAHPERVDKLVLFEPFYIDDAVREAIRNFAKSGFKPFEMKPDGSHLMERWQQIRRTYPDMSLEQVTRDLIDNLKAGQAAGAGRLLVLNYPMEKRLPLIQAPTFIIWGNKDLPGFPPENKLKVNQIIPRNQVLNFDGIPNLRVLADKFAPLILDFLDKQGV